MATKTKAKKAAAAPAKKSAPAEKKNTVGEWEKLFSKLQDRAQDFDNGKIEGSIWKGQIQPLITRYRSGERSQSLKDAIAAVK